MQNQSVMELGYLAMALAVELPCNRSWRGAHSPLRRCHWAESCQLRAAMRPQREGKAATRGARFRSGILAKKQDFRDEGQRRTTAGPQQAQSIKRVKRPGVQETGNCNCRSWTQSGARTTKGSQVARFFFHVPFFGDTLNKNKYL